MPLNNLLFLKRANCSELQPRVANQSLVCFIFVTFALLCAACNMSDVPSASPASENSSGLNTAASAASDDKRNTGTRPRIVAFGDSLTAGYGLSPAESYPSLLQERLDQDGFNYEVVNAGVSGDTTSGGLRRIAWALDGTGGKVEIVILELGANDILRGQPVEQMRRNLAQIIEESQKRGARVLLAGMLSPPNWGADYNRQVVEAYRSLAEEYNAPLIPFFLEGIATRRELNLQDGAHPNAEGTKLVAETVYKALRPMLEEKR